MKIKMIENHLLYMLVDGAVWRSAYSKLRRLSNSYRSGRRARRRGALTDRSLGAAGGGGGGFLDQVKSLHKQQT